MRFAELTQHFAEQDVVFWQLKESESRHRSQLEQMSKLLQFSTVKVLSHY